MVLLVRVTPLAITAITNFVWACEAFLLSGQLLGRRPPVGSAAWLWAMAMVVMGVSALLGGIDHGFFEPRGAGLARTVMQKATWLAAGVLALLTLLTTVRQFAPGTWWAPLLAAGLVQLAVFAFLAIRIDSFLVVILDYTPVAVALLVLSAAGARAGSGSWQMALGLALSFAASAIQAAGVDALSPVDRNGLYHLILIVASLFLYAGGLRLKV
jgi:hypothetical protein